MFFSSKLQGIKGISFYFYTQYPLTAQKLTDNFQKI